MGILDAMRGFKQKSLVSDDRARYDDYGDYGDDDYEDIEDSEPYPYSSRSSRPSDYERRKPSAGRGYDRGYERGYDDMNESDVVSLSKVSISDVIFSYPEDFEACSGICDMLKAQKMVIAFFDGVDTASGQRMVDFLAGCVTAIRGNIEHVTGKAYLLVPADVNISDEFKEHLKSSGVLPSFSRGDGMRRTGTR